MLTEAGRRRLDRLRGHADDCAAAGAVVLANDIARAIELCRMMLELEESSRVFDPGKPDTVLRNAMSAEPAVNSILHFNDIEGVDPPIGGSPCL